MSTASSLDALTGFAVDLGGTKLAAARFERGKAVGRERCVTDGAASLEVQVDAMAQLLRRLGHRPSLLHFLCQISLWFSDQVLMTSP